MRAYTGLWLCGSLVNQMELRVGVQMVGKTCGCLVRALTCSCRPECGSCSAKRDSRNRCNAGSTKGCSSGSLCPPRPSCQGTGKADPEEAAVGVCAVRLPSLPRWLRASGRQNERTWQRQRVLARTRCRMENGMGAERAAEILRQSLRQEGKG